MADRLELDSIERRTVALEAIEALERLRSLRASNGSHTTADHDLIERARAAPSPEGVPLAEILDEFVRFAAAGWDKTSAGNFSFIPNGSLDAGTAAAMLATGANTYTGVAFEAPPMVAMEEGVLRWIADVLGLPPTAGGLLLSGGSLANQTAIITARSHAAGATSATMYASDRVHHSVVKAARLVGIGPEAIRTVATDALGAATRTRFRA